MASLWIFQIVSIMMILLHSPMSIMGDQIPIGVAYQTLSNENPPPVQVINLYKEYGIGKIRLYTPNIDILEQLRRSNIEVAMGIKNEDISPLVGIDNAKSWCSQFVQPYIKDVLMSHIIVGNEAIPGEFAEYVLYAMENLQTVLDYNDLGYIIVTTAVSTKVLDYHIPPSAAQFTPEASVYLPKVLRFLEYHNSYLMANVYPYYDYAADPEDVGLEFAQFTSDVSVIGDYGRPYWDMFDATIDAFYWAMERAGGPNVSLGVSETGWPSAGNENLTVPALASTYNKNLVKHVLENKGTPKRPGPNFVDTYIFNLFDQNLESNKIRKTFGMFFPDSKPIYPLFDPVSEKSHFKAAPRAGRKKKSRRVY